MPLRRSVQSGNRSMALAPDDAADAVPVYAEFIARTGEFLANDVIEMLAWPAGTVIHSLKAHIEKLDTGVAVTLDLGVLTGRYLNALDDASAQRVCGSEFGAALTTGQAGGSVDVLAALILSRGPTMALDRSIGFKISAAPTALIAGARIRLSAIFVPVPQGVAFV